MNQKIKMAIRGVRHPSLVLALVDRKLKLTKKGKVSHDGERLVIKDWASAIKSDSFVTLAHVHRYLWVQNYLKSGVCLDAGCGSGYGTNFIAETCPVTEITGIDIDEEAVEYCQTTYKKTKLHFKKMSVTQMDFPDDYFDHIISFDVLEHLSEEGQKKFLSEVNRTLKASGTAYIGCPNGQRIANWKPNKFHLRELTQIEFEQLLRENFGSVNTIGQDIIFEGIRQKEKQANFVPKLTISNFVIVQDGYMWGLLSVCNKQKPLANK
jgi:2-polyprenyl-3-methyl-5-hydroxy-6-metoxy-1,4-benzoquinol methylase